MVAKTKKEEESVDKQVSKVVSDLIPQIDVIKRALEDAYEKLEEEREVLNEKMGNLERAIDEIDNTAETLAVYFS